MIVLGKKNDFVWQSMILQLCQNDGAFGALGLLQLSFFVSDGLILNVRYPVRHTVIEAFLR